MSEMVCSKCLRLHFIGPCPFEPAAPVSETPREAARRHMELSKVLDEARDKALYNYTAGGTIYEEEHFRKGWDAAYKHILLANPGSLFGYSLEEIRAMIDERKKNGG